MNVDGRIIDLLTRWDAAVPPLVDAAAAAHEEAEDNGSWGKADELAFDRDEVMSQLGAEAIDLLREMLEL